MNMRIIYHLRFMVCLNTHSIKMISTKNLIDAKEKLKGVQVEHLIDN